MLKCMECVCIAGGEKRQLYVPVMGEFLYNEHQSLIMHLVVVKLRRCRTHEG